jgi:hypothetical protein
MPHLGAAEQEEREETSHPFFLLAPSYTPSFIPNESKKRRRPRQKPVAVAPWRKAARITQGSLIAFKDMTLNIR